MYRVSFICFFVSFLCFFSLLRSAREVTYPMVSPLPSSLDHPAPVESSLPSQSSSSEAVMLTISLNSLRGRTVTLACFGGEDGRRG